MEEWVDKMNFRSSMSAKQLFDDGVLPSNSRPIVRSIFAFIKKLLLREEYFKGKWI